MLAFSGGAGKSHIATVLRAAGKIPVRLIAAIILLAGPVAAQHLPVSGANPAFVGQRNIVPENVSQLRSPLEQPPDLLFNLATGNSLARRTLRLSVGTHQTDPNGPTTGTGNQFYQGGIDYGVNDWLQVGVSYQYFEDPPGFAINGLFPETQIATLSVNAKVRVYRGKRFAIAARGSIERFSFKSNIFNSRNDNSSLQYVKSLQLPVTYQVSPTLQVHLTPAIALFAKTINGIPFYGTIASIGTGVSWQPSRRWLAYATLNIPVGPGGNTISNTAGIIKRPVYTLGARYNISPKAGVEIYATNGMGATPATGILSFFPDGNILLVGARLVYTPGNGPGYRPNYRGVSSQPLSPQNQHLQLDGFTLASADTLSAGSVLGTSNIGSYGNSSRALIVSPDHDGQVEFVIENYAVDGSVGAPDVLKIKFARYMIGAKLRLLDQNNGSPFSLAVRALLGRDFSARRNGTFYLDAPTSYKFNQTTTLLIVPKIAAFGNQRKFGLGIGLNKQIFPGFQIVAELTPVASGPAVWAAGVRYRFRNTPLRVDLHATNAVGRYGLGTMVAQNSLKIALGVNVRINLQSLRP